MINPRQHILHRGLTSIQGPLVFVRNAEGVGLYDRVEVLVRDGGESRIGRIVSIAGEHIVVEVFQGTEGLSLGESRLRLLSEPILLDVGPCLRWYWPTHRRWTENRRSRASARRRRSDQSDQT